MKHAKAACEEMRQSVKSLFPPGFVEHRCAAHVTEFFIGSLHFAVIARMGVSLPCLFSLEEKAIWCPSVMTQAKLTASAPLSTASATNGVTSHLASSQRV